MKNFLLFLTILLFITISHTGNLYAQNCQIIELSLTAATCNDNGTVTDPSDDYYDIELTFNYVDGTTYSVTDASSG